MAQVRPRVCGMRNRLSILTSKAIVRVRRTYEVILTVLMLVMHGVSRLNKMLLPNVFLAMRRLGSIRRREHTEGDRYSGVEIQIG